MKRLKELERNFGVNLDGNRQKQELNDGEEGGDNSIEIKDNVMQSVNGAKALQSMAEDTQITMSGHKRLNSQQPGATNYHTTSAAITGNDPHPLNIKNSNQLNSNKQRSVAAKAGQMQIFAGNGQQAQSESGLMLQGQASQISNSYESYLGRKQIIQQQRDRKEALLRQLENGKMQSSASPPGSADDNKRTNIHQNHEFQAPIQIRQNELPLKEISNNQQLVISGQSTGMNGNTTLLSNIENTNAALKLSQRPPLQKQINASNNRQFLIEDVELNPVSYQTQPRNRQNSYQNIQQQNNSPKLNQNQGQANNSVKSSQVLRQPNLLRASNINLQLSLREGAQTMAGQTADTTGGLGSSTMQQQILGLPLSISSNNGLYSANTLNSNGSYMRGPPPMGQPKTLRLGSRQKGGQAPSQNQQYNSLLPPQIKPQGSTISSLEGPGRRRQIAALRTQQNQNEQLAYATGPSAVSVGESSNNLNIGGAPQYLSNNGFLEHMGMYQNANNQGSNSVHNLKGNHKIHHFRNGMMPFPNNQEYIPGTSDLLGCNSLEQTKLQYGTKNNTNTLTGGIVNNGPSFAITGDQLIRPSVPKNDCSSFPGPPMKLASEGFRPQHEQLLQDKRLSPLGQTEQYGQQTPSRQDQANNRSLLSNHPVAQSQSYQNTSELKQVKNYDYLFVQMSNEQFQREYNNRKVQIQRPQRPPFGDQQEKHLQFQTQASQNWQQSPRGYTNNRGPMPSLGIGGQKYGPSSPQKSTLLGGGAAIMSPQGDAPNLMGIVNVQKYERAYTNEVPPVTCHLLPTQMDHLKVLLCEEEIKGNGKLTQDASERCEIEKQSQVKQYMEDIIVKLKMKDRKHKVTVKKKFIEDALTTPTAGRVASVYVLVINREKNYDPIISQKIGQKLRQAQRRPSEKTGKMRTGSVNTNPDPNGEETSSSEDEAEVKARLEHEKYEIMQNRRIMGGIRKSAYPGSKSKDPQGKYCYDSDTNGEGKQGTDRMNSTTTSSTIPKLKKQSFIDANGLEHSTLNKRKRSTGPVCRPLKVDDVKFKWVAPVKVFPEKYGPTKIKIIQDVNVHKHHRTHKLNVFFQQYNEFQKIMFKNQKASAQSQKFNLNYAIGLAKCLGLKVNKDTFCEQNLKSRDHLTQMKEKISFCLIKRIQDENNEIFPTPLQGAALKQAQDSEQKVDDSETIDSSCGTDVLSIKQEKSNDVNIKTSAQKQDTNNGPSESQHIRNDGGVMYKYCIGKGNNSLMVRSLFKNRFWWMQSDKSAEMEKVNFMWTQIKNAVHMGTLLCKYPNQKSGVTSMNKNSQGGGPGNLSTAHSSSKTVNAITSTPTSTSTKSNKKKKAQNMLSGDKSNAPSKILAADVKTQQLTQQQINHDNAAKLLETKLYNKIEDNFHMANKKALLLNMRNYYEGLNENVFDSLPVTFHIKNGLSDPEWARFKAYYDKAEEEIKIKKALKLKKRQEKLAAEAEASHSPESSPEKTDRPKELGLEPQKPEIDSAVPEFHQSSAPMKNIWILKPGENTNCGNGIQVARDFNEIVEIVTEAGRNGRKRTCIVQKYIHSPLLIHRRKFDIRTYAMLTSIGGQVHGYVYEEGYIRTSSYEFDLSNLSDRLVHLTNDAVQKRDKGYGKHEPGNKMSYNEFQHYLDRYHGELNVCFERDLLPQMNKMTTDIFRAVHGKVDPKRRVNTFEVFGLDFMIDDEFKLYLIEVNTNPCLELASPLLARLIPNMLENALKVAVDPMFPPPEHYSQKKAFVGDPCPENRFELIFDSSIDGPVLDAVMKTRNNVIIELDEEDLSDEEEHPDGDQQDNDDQE